MLRQLLIKALIVNLVIIIGVLLFGFYKGWSTLFQFGEAIALCGFLIIGIGTLSVFGFWSGSRNAETQYAQSVSRETISQRTQNNLNDAYSNYSFQLHSILSGAIAIAIGTILQMYFSG